jgi:hypothetical protein
MDLGLVSAGAGLVGATIGAAMSFLGSWVVHQKKVRAQWLGQDRLRRQDLYKEFIQKASRCYVDALQHEKPDVSLLVALYGKISRMRVISSPQVLAAAEQVLRRIVDVYFEPPVEFSSARVRSMLQDGSVDVLRGFSQCCRAEFEMLGAEQL